METKNEGQSAGLRFARVLVVDDMIPIQVMTAAMIRKYNIQADCVSGGQEALNRIKSGEPVYNAIFMDHLMPGMDGIETVRQIRSLDTHYAKNIPVIALTGDDSAENETLFLQNGFQAFMTKPLSFAKLEPVLREWIRGNDQGGGA